MVRIAASAICNRCVSIVLGRFNHFRIVVVVGLNHSTRVHRIVMRRRTHNHRIADGQHKKEFLNTLRLLRIRLSGTRLQHVFAQFGIDDDRWCGCARFRVGLFQFGRRVIVVDAIYRAFAK